MSSFSLKDKRKILNQFKGEVKDFHPLLDNLFKKLPSVIRVDYTHGPSEKGADFIIYSDHHILGEKNMIGVIAKIGEINKNLQDIENQIDDCSLERYTLNGKTKSTLDEIWIVNNDTITNNAKEKIYDKFRSKNIKFISDKELISLIDQYLPNYWFSIPLTLGEYLSKLWISNDNLDKSLCLINVDDKRFYIPQDLHRWDDGSYSSKVKKKDPINIYSEINVRKCVLIEGGMGSGKSKLLRQIIDYYSKPENYLLNKVIPVLSTFREIVEKYNCDINKAVADKTSTISPGELTNESGCSYLLLIDGVDEKKIDMEDQRSKLSEIINNFYNSENIRGVIASRNLAYLDEETSLLNKTSRIYIKNLNTNDVIKFISKLCVHLKASDRIYEDIKKSVLFKELPKSTIGVILLAKLLNENGEDLPQNLTELYSKYLELMLGRWDIEKGLQSQKEYEIAETVIMILADYMLTNDIGFLSREEVIQKFDDYLRARNLNLSSENIYSNILQRSEILEEDNFGRVSFKHRTFMEYYYAKKSTRGFALQIDNQIFHSYWINTYYFYIGLIRDCPEIIQKVSEIKPDLEVEKWIKLINMGSLFLAGYQSPYQVIKDNFKNVIVEATELYYGIVKNGNESFFSRLPQMQLLSLLQGVLRNSYSYKFFEKAIDDTIIEIDRNDQYEIDFKIYALFFLGCISMDLNKSDPYDYLISEYGKILPLPIELAIGHQMDEMKKPTDLMKKLEKRTLKHLKISQSHKAIAENLYSRPINIKKLS